jgi:outer membrane protein assembly factor BamB
LFPNARRRWFPVAWVALLLAIWGAFAIHDAWQPGDLGKVNSIGHAAVILATLGLSGWVLRSSGLAWGRRLLLGFLPLILVGGHYLQLMPWEAIHNGDVGIVGWRWRWAEPDRLLAAPVGKATGEVRWDSTPSDYPRFLGIGYWAEAPGVALDIERLSKPPRELWRQPIGAGWSAFAVRGGYAVTQEQRGPDELVTCYEVASGELVWSHADPVRWDPKGGGALGYPGPRATPTIDGGRVYAHGATGIVNCLDARTGKRLWSHDTLREQNTQNVMWGKSGSPLLTDGLVVISVGGSRENSLVAYDAQTGAEVWAAGSRRSSYASPIVCELVGTPQIVVVNEGYVVSHRVGDGKLLWEYPWPSGSDTDAASSQPVPVGGDRLFFSKGYGLGSALVQVSLTDGGQWTVEPIWRKKVMKTKMGNVVLHDGSVYGLDDVYLQCVDLESGRSRWKKRRRPTFGHGQVLLVDDLLLVVTEAGEVVIVAADPRGYRELAAFQAVNGLTWNNPSLSGRYLLVRNAQEAACFELPLVDD